MISAQAVFTADILTRTGGKAHVLLILIDISPQYLSVYAVMVWRHVKHYQLKKPKWGSPVHQVYFYTICAKVKVFSVKTPTSRYCG